MSVTYPYPRPSVTCDAVIFTMRADDLAILLIKRKDEPFKGHWALPGGFVNENESLDRAAARELAEETGLTGVKLEQLGAFGEPGRDPRGHTITIAWLTFVVAEAKKIKAGDDAASAEWHSFRTLTLEDAAIEESRSVPPPPPMRNGTKTTKTTRQKTKSVRPLKLAFDHAKIIAHAYNRLCVHLDNPLRDHTFDLVPSRFTIPELHHFYETVLGRELPMRTFRKRVIGNALVMPATSKPASKPAAQLYRWNRS